MKGFIFFLICITMVVSNCPATIVATLSDQVVFGPRVIIVQKFVSTIQESERFTFHPDGRIECQKSGFYKFELTTNVNMQGIGEKGDLQVTLWIGGQNTIFADRSPIDAYPGTNYSGRTLVGTSKLNVGDIIKVYVSHDVTTNQIHLPKNSNILVITNL